MVEQFSTGYRSQVDLERISFKWNGKHAEEFDDQNGEFRRTVAEFIIDSKEAVPYELIRDIFIEDAKWAKEAWGTSNIFPSIAEKMLKVGQEYAILDFLYGFSMSFDTYACCHTIDLSGIDLQKFINFIDNQINEESDETTLKMLEAGREFFTKHLQGNAADGWVGLKPGVPITNIKVIHPLSTRIKFIAKGFLKKLFGA